MRFSRLAISGVTVVLRPHPGAPMPLCFSLLLTHDSFPGESPVGTYYLAGLPGLPGRESALGDTPFPFTSSHSSNHSKRDSISVALSQFPPWSSGAGPPSPLVQRVARAEDALFSDALCSMLAWCAAILLRRSEEVGDSRAALDDANEVLDVMEVQSS